MTDDLTEVSPLLSVDEQDDLTRHEATIEAGLDSFVAVGEALADIRDRRLYRVTHQAFSDYLIARWPRIGSRRQADRLIAAAEVERDLRPIGLSVAHESQVRDLASLAAGERREAMQRATDAAGGKAPTAAQVKAAAQEVRPPVRAGGDGPARRTPPPPPPTPSPVAAPATPPIGEVIAEVSVDGSDGALVAEVVPARAPVRLDAGLLKQAEALVALLDQSLTLAQVERDRLRGDLPDTYYDLPDDVVETAARAFLAAPALRGAATFLAMSAKEVTDAVRVP